MAPDELQGEYYGPTTEMWNRLAQALNDSSEAIHAELGPAGDLLEAVGDGVLQLKTGLFTAPGGAPISPELAKLMPRLSAEDQVEVLTKVSSRYPDLSPWVKEAVNLSLAREGYRRIEKSFARFKDVQTSVLAKPIPDRAQRYVVEVVHTYLFGFDPATIALARATFENLGETALISTGAMSEAQIEKAKLTAGRMRERLMTEGLLVTEAETAERLIKRGDDVAHGRLHSSRVLPQLALDSVTELSSVARELGKHL